MMNNAITDESYEVITDPLVVVCTLTLRERFTVEGISVCFDKKTFNLDEHKIIALRHARAKLPELEGKIYEDLLKQ